MINLYIFYYENQSFAVTHDWLQIAVLGSLRRIGGPETFQS